MSIHCAYGPWRKSLKDVDAGDGETLGVVEQVSSTEIVMRRYFEVSQKHRRIDLWTVSIAVLEKLISATFGHVSSIDRCHH